MRIAQVTSGQVTATLTPHSQRHSVGEWRPPSPYAVLSGTVLLS
jgi:hypothetical protein